MKNVTYIHNAQIVLENGILWDGALVIEDGIIAQVAASRKLKNPLALRLLTHKVPM